jgi:sarcosine oxidase gamma subunit
VLELRRTRRSIVVCCGEPDALDGLRVPSTTRVPVAPNELLLIGNPGDAGHTMVAAEKELGERDPAGLVVDVSGGYVTWTLTGEGRFEACQRLCAVPVTSDTQHAQALFAHVPAKVLVDGDALHLIVSSAVAHHVRSRLVGACADLGVSEVPEEAVAAPGAGA